MDYKQKYKKALERAQEWYNVSDASELDKSLLEGLFPELKENEDERMKKLCISVVKQFAAVCRKEDKYLPEVEKCIAWLEKQGEQKSMKTCAEYYNQDNELKMPELSEFQDKLADILMYREYDGPDETEDDIARGRLEYELAAIRLSEELLPLAQKEQKPAWNEEDEEIHRKCICAMRASACGFPEEEKFVEQVDNWLKSLKDRVLPQQEWSEEDNDMLDKVIHRIEQLDHYWNKPTDEKMINWLKSLKPQNTWKPSEEQMNTLEQWLKDNQYKGDARYCYPIFESLYQDLKKLKG